MDTDDLSAEKWADQFYVESTPYRRQKVDSLAKHLTSYRRAVVEACRPYMEHKPDCMTQDVLKRLKSRGRGHYDYSCDCGMQAIAGVGEE